MQLVKINREGVEACYQEGLVKPNEFRQFVKNMVEKELYLRKEKVSSSGFAVSVNLFIHSLLKINYFEKLYQELSDCKEDTFQCIINLAGNNPEKLLLTEEESKKLFLANVFYKKAVIVRDCSDIFKHPLVKEERILVDKETLRSLSYLTTYSATGKALLRELNNDKE